MTETTSSGGLLAETRESGNNSGPSDRHQDRSSPESATPASTDPTPRTEADKLADVHRLLSGAESDEDGDRADPDPAPAPEASGDEDSAPEPQEAKDEGPLSVQRLAEKLETTPAEVYKMQVTTGDGQTVTLGELKDAYVERGKAARETAQREASLDERESAIQHNQRLWASVRADLDGKLSPETQQQMREHQQAREQSERRKMLEAMPELGDPNTGSKVRQDMVDLLTKEYGFKPQEIVVEDHRMLLVLRDLMRTKERLSKLLAYEPRKDPPKAAQTGARATASGNRKAMLHRAKNGTETDKVAAVAQLIGN